MKSVPSDKHYWYSSDKATIYNGPIEKNKYFVIIVLSVLFITTSIGIGFTVSTLNKIKSLENNIKDLTKALNTIKRQSDLNHYDDEEIYNEDPSLKSDDVDFEVVDDEWDNEEYHNKGEYYENNEYDIEDNSLKDFVSAERFTKDFEKRSISDEIVRNYQIDEQERNKSLKINPSAQVNQNLWRPLAPYHHKIFNQDDSTKSVEFRVERDDHRRRNVETFEPPIRVGRMRPLPTAHFSGDTSRYSESHPNYRGNGHLRHPRKTFIDWKESDWVRGLGMNQHFDMENGKLTIKESGIYFVYAQIYYLDVYDSNGFTVKKNSETLLQCTVTFHSRERDFVGNTCYTAGAEYLTEGDVISLKDLSEGRYTIFSPARSFFGLIKLGDVKM